MDANKLEKTTLDGYRKRLTLHLPADPNEAWTVFCLRMALEAAGIVRSLRLNSLSDQAVFKPDGSPVTTAEEDIEQMVIDALHDYFPTAVFAGEETGGEVPEKGMAVAMDPIDGTWSFLGRMETIATTLAVYRDGQPCLGLVSNPVTGEIGYAWADGPARLIQLSLYGEGDRHQPLPLSRSTPDSILVNLHPHRNAESMIQNLFQAWQQDRIQIVRMAGGSPCIGLLDAAKGSYIYLNLWPGRPAQSFDLAPGALILKAAGGEIVDRSGQAVELSGHQGLFIAGCDSVTRLKLLNIIQEVPNAI